jgi:hypothetical protein
MKNLFLVLSVLGLFAYGCNKNNDQAAATGSGAGIEKEEAVDDVDSDINQERMQEKNEEHRREQLDGQSPGFEKDEYREDDANITTPIDSRPDLEEEE